MTYSGFVVAYFAGGALWLPLVLLSLAGVPSSTAAEPALGSSQGDTSSLRSTAHADKRRGAASQVAVTSSP